MKVLLNPLMKVASWHNSFTKPILALTMKLMNTKVIIKVKSKSNI